MPVLSGAALGYFAWQYRFAPVRYVPTARSGPLSAQLPASDRLRFFVIGDSGSGDAAQMQVAKAMDRRCREAALDGIIPVGDVFYEDGATSVDAPPATGAGVNALLTPPGPRPIHCSMIFTGFGERLCAGGAWRAAVALLVAASLGLQVFPLTVAQPAGASTAWCSLQPLNVCDTDSYSPGDLTSIPALPPAAIAVACSLDARRLPPDLFTPALKGFPTAVDRPPRLG